MYYNCNIIKMDFNQEIKELIQKKDLTNLKIKLDSPQDISVYSQLLLYWIKNDASLEILNLLLNYVDTLNFFNSIDDKDLECIKLVFKKLIFNNSFVADIIKYIKKYPTEYLSSKSVQNELTDYIYSLAIQNNFDIVKYLLNYETKDSLQEINSKYNLLITAVEKNHLSIVRYLINNGVNVNEENSRHESAVIIAFKKGYISLAKMLLSNEAKVNDQEIIEIVKIAINKNNLKIFECLIENNININNKKDRYNNSPLHLAVKEKKLDCVKYLLENGANINDKNKDGQTPLFIAYDNNDKDTLHTLIRYNANINDTNNDGETLLFLAVKDNDIELVKFLINSDADLNVKDKDGSTPLMIASHERYFQVVRWLVKGGANINERNKYHDTALYYSSPIYGYKKEIYNLLKVRGACE